MLPSRSRIHQLTRDVGFIWKTCAGILLLGVIVAVLVHSLRTHRPVAGVVDLDERISRLFLINRSYHDELLHAEKADPGAVADWLRLTGESAGSFSGKFDNGKLIVGAIDINEVLVRHIAGPAQRQLFSDYARCLLMAKNDAGRKQARERLRSAAALRPALRFAAEFEGDLLADEGRRPEALQEYLREIGSDDARYDRAQAVALSLSLEDARTARLLCDDARTMRETSARLQGELAKLCGDRSLMWSSMMRVQLQRFSNRPVLALALLAGAIWFVVLVYSSGTDRMAWLRYAAPVVAGVMSIWLLAFWMSMMPYGQEEGERAATMGQEIMHWILDVGLPEEAVKLVLFLPLLPVLLRRRSTADAALTGGCVGLGFALNENLGYYLQNLHAQGGVALAVGRLITANFLHIALTGIAGAWLYEMVRSKFHRAGEFIAVFAAVAVAHGLYDFSATGGYAAEWGFEIIGIMILAAASRFFFDLLKPDDVVLRRRVVSCTFVFCNGVALLAAVVIVASVWQMDSMAGASGTLRTLVGVIPVGLIYVREFREL